MTGTDRDSVADVRAGPTPVAAWVGVGMILIIAAGLTIYAGRGVTFQIDEWQWIQSRTSPGAASLLEPFHHHWMTVPIAIHQVLYRIVGLDSHLPYRLVLLAAHLVAAFVLFLYLKTRVREWIALAATAIFALYGYAAAITVWPISLGWAIAMACVISALLLVDRTRSRADFGATVLLLVAVASTTVAVPFVIGLAVETTMRREWRRVWVSLVPLAAYGLWYLAYEGQGSDTGGTVGQTLRFGQELLAQTVGSLLGIQARGSAADVALVVVLGALAVAWFALGRPVTPRLVGNATALVVLTAALAVARAGTGLTTWYSYAVAVALFLTTAELLSHAGTTRRVVAGTVPPVAIWPVAIWPVAIWAVAIWALVWNVGQLERITDGFREIASAERSQLAALELIEDDVAFDFHPGPLLQTLTAGRYREVAAEYGTPAYTVAQVLHAPHRARRAADEVLVRGLHVRPQPSTRDGDGPPIGDLTIHNGDERSDGCTVVRANGSGGDAIVELRSPTLDVLVQAPSGAAQLRAGVFAGASQPIGDVAAGATARVRAPAVPEAGEWTLRVRTPGAVRFCAPSG